MGARRRDHAAGLQNGTVTVNVKERSGDEAPKRAALPAVNTYPVRFEVDAKARRPALLFWGSKIKYFVIVIAVAGSEREGVHRRRVGDRLRPREGPAEGRAVQRPHSNIRDYIDSGCTSLALLC